MLDLCLVFIVLLRFGFSVCLDHENHFHFEAMSMAPETTKSFAGHHIDSDGSMDVRSSNAATLAGIDAAAPLHDLEPDTVSHGSDEDIYLRHDSNKTKAHHRGIRKSMTKVKNVIKKPFNAKHETEPCHCHGIRHSSSSDPADPEVITTHPLNGNPASYLRPNYT